MSKSSRAVWADCIASLSGQGMPECPKDLNEPKYLALLYDHTCTVGGDGSPELSSESDHVDYSSAHER
jgi:hypothetical protein